MSGRSLKYSAKLANAVLVLGVLSLCGSVAFVAYRQFGLKPAAPVPVITRQDDVTFTDQARQAALSAYNRNPENNTYSYETSQMPMPLVGN